MAIGIPGSPGYSLPAGEDEVMRRLANIERRMTEERAALTQSFEKTVNELQATIAGMVEFGSIGFSSAAFNVPVAYGSVASRTIDIPAGFTRAAVLGVVGLGAWNGSTATDYVYVRAVINGSPGASMPESAGPSSYRAVSASAIRTLDGLVGGGTISVGVECKAASGWGSSTANIANIDVIVLFRR